MAERYRKIPVEVEAVRFDGTNQEAIGHFAGLKARLAGRERRLEIVTLEGVFTVPPGWWVIKGVEGEFYACKPSVFEKTYEPAESADSGEGEQA